MDEQKENLIHLDSWRKAVNPSIPAIEEEEEWYEEGSIPAFFGVSLAAAYTRGILDGRREVWMSLRWHILLLTATNAITLATLWWLT